MYLSAEWSHFKISSNKSSNYLIQQNQQLHGRVMLKNDENIAMFQLIKNQRVIFTCETKLRLGF